MLEKIILVYSGRGCGWSGRFLFYVGCSSVRPTRGGKQSARHAAETTVTGRRGAEAASEAGEFFLQQIPELCLLRQSDSDPK